MSATLGLSYNVTPNQIVTFLVLNQKVVAKIVGVKSKEYDAYELILDLGNYEMHRDKLLDQMLLLAPNFISRTPLPGFIENDGYWIHTDYPLTRDFSYAEPIFKNVQKSKPTYAPLEYKVDFATKLPFEFDGQPSPNITRERAEYAFTYALTNIFSEHIRASSRRINGVSAYTYYLKHRQELLEEAGKEENMKYSMSELIWVRNRIPTLFQVTWAKYIYTMFNAKTVLDPSAGWGDRLLGAAAAGVTTYHGVDPNSKMTSAYKSMIAFVTRMTGMKFGSFNVRKQSFLDVQIPSNHYDLCFTSPPYYNYEIYSQDENQSIVQHEKLEDWITKFMFPYVTKAVDAVKPGGTFALYMTDTSAMFPYIKRIIDHTNTIATYRGVIAFNMYPLWVWRK